MKTITMLFMLLICMVSFTVTGTTTKPEQEQKPIIHKDLVKKMEIVNVEAMSEVIHLSVQNYNPIDLCVYDEQKEATYLDPQTIKDVGWRHNQKANTKVKVATLKKPRQFIRSNC